jgi:tetratricopeptide (TPR) repeat protein
VQGPDISEQSARGSGIAQADRGGVATVNITQVYQAAIPAAIDPKEQTAAAQRLEQLPLDVVRAPAGLPLGSWMPLRPNALFVGREAELRALASALKAGGTAAVGQSTAVTGLGGIGKTQLASEFAYRYGQYFAGGVFWLTCANPEAIPAEVATSGRQLNLHPDFAGLPLDGQVSLVASAWHSELPRLLVFDNCEDEGVLETWLPRGGGGRVLVTSRRQEWRPDLAVQAVRLDVLARAESQALLRKHRPALAPDDPVLDAIAAELGDLPLALHLAGSFLARYRHAPSGEPAAYLAAVRQPNLLEHRSLIIEGASPTGHEQHVARTFALSYGQLRPADEVDAMTLVILARAAWFAPGEPIPRGLLGASAGVDGADEAAVLRFEDGLLRLRELGLIAEQENGALVLHRLLAAFVRSESDDERTHRQHVEAAVLAEARRLNHAGYPGPLLAWQPQLRFVAEQATATGSEHAGSLLVNLGYHLNMMAAFDDARAAYERSLEIDQSRLGPNHPDIALRVNNLGNVLKDLGDLAGARTAFERALAIGETGPDHPQVVIYINNLGEVLRAQGDLAGARRPSSGRSGST